MKPKPKPKPKPPIPYIDRDLLTSPYCIGLCLSERAFQLEMDRLNVKEDRPKWVKDGADGNVHYFDSSDGGKCCIVCVRVKEKAVELEVLGIIIHEAVHVWQAIADDLGEREPSKEFEAYSVQTIAQRLIQEWRRKRK